MIDSTVVSAIECTIHSKPSECDLGSFCVVCGRAYPGVLKRPDVSAFFKNPDASSLFRRDTMSLTPSDSHLRKTIMSVNRRNQNECGKRIAELREFQPKRNKIYVQF